MDHVDGLIECVPNFSEGRRREVVDQIVEAIRSAGVRLLDVESDPDHNRSVVTFVGDGSAVAEAAFRGAAKAADLIDLRSHKGEHPRMGATDVIPFIPLRGATMEECVRLAEGLGERIGRELGIPVYLYEKAARTPARENLADVRKGEFEGLLGLVGTDPARDPDFGPARLHPTAGATAVGARMPLVAFNVNLGTSDVGVAKAIAKAVRHSGGGLRYVKAMGFEIKERGIVQVSMNLVNYQGSPIFRVFDMIEREAKRYGVPVVGSEVIGLVPMEALIDCAAYYLRLEGFKLDQVLENRLWSGE